MELLLLNFNNLYDEFTLKSFELKKVSIFFRDKLKITHVFHHNIWNYTSVRKEILDIIKKLFEANYDENTLYRSTWIIFSNLKNTSFHQTSIFEKTYILENKNSNLITTINKINTKFKKHKISFWSDLLNSDFNSKSWIRK